MKLRHIYIYIYSFICLANKAQLNLVPNYSFEDTLKCFWDMGVKPPFSINPNISDWYTSDRMTPDYYNSCANYLIYPFSSTPPQSCWGYQMPRTGNGYVGAIEYGIFTPWDSTHISVEYISVKLKDSLKTDHCYYGEFYVSLADYFTFGINQISMLLTNNTFSTSVLSFTNTIQPQIQWDTTKYFTDTLNWVKISGTFKALGGEKYLTIGNFKDGDHTKKTGLISNFIAPCNPGSFRFSSYIFIDDVALYELPTPQLGSLNYTICNNSDSLVLGDTARLQTTYQWFANGLPISTSNTIIVKPTQTTNYVLQSTQCGVTNQTITVTYSTNCEPVVVTEPVIPNVFTPNYDNVNDTFKFNLYNSFLKSFTIYDRWGLEMYTTHLNQHHVIWDGRTTSGIESTAGVYFYVLEYTDVNGDTHKKNGYVTLIK